MFEKKEITKKSENISEWYQDVILKANLAEHSPVRGAMTFKPYGFAIWEHIQKFFDERLKSMGVQNCYFPLFIPESFIQKEKEHVEGFSPELAVVTIAGGKKLKEKLVVRPTSETIIYEAFSRWIQSWRDLPLKINQWANVVRWELRPRFFLRTSEFLWQEAHCCFKTEKENFRETLKALNLYHSFLKEVLALDGICGKKSPFDKFPGAKETFTIEGLMPDGKALQLCTTHDLGQNFSKVFNIKFKDKDGKEKFVWQNCWGLTTRVIGAIVLSHGDDQGLILPPKIAPIQIVIVPIFKKEKEKLIKEKIEKIKEQLKGWRVFVDLRKEYSVGYKFHEWELKGVPLRLEIGEKEIKEKKLTLARRDNFEKVSVLENDLNRIVKEIFEAIHQNLLSRARKSLKENTKKVFSFDEFKEVVKKGFALAPWCERKECEEKIKKITMAGTRCLPLKAKKIKEKCILCKRGASFEWVFARAY